MVMVRGVVALPVVAAFVFLAAAPAARAEDLDPEKFYPVELICGTGDDVSLTKGNAAGRFVRFIRRDGVLVLQTRNVETKYRFETDLRIKVSESAGLTDPLHRRWSELALAQLDTLTDKVCKAGEDARRRYRSVLVDFRRKIGLDTVPE